MPTAVSLEPAMTMPDMTMALLLVPGMITLGTIMPDMTKAVFLVPAMITLDTIMPGMTMPDMTMAVVLGPGMITPDTTTPGIITGSVLRLCRAERWSRRTPVPTGPPRPPGPV